MTKELNLQVGEVATDEKELVSGTHFLFLFWNMHLFVLGLI